MVNLLALPIAVATFTFLLFLIRNLTTLRTAEIVRPVFVCLLLIIPFHEFVHALFNPGAGFTRSTVVGFWPSHVLFYAFHHGEMSRKRFLAVLLAPFGILTAAPTILISAFGLPTPIVASIALANGAGSAGDLLGLIVVLLEIPRGARVRNQGWRTYWKQASDVGPRASGELEATLDA